MMDRTCGKCKERTSCVWSVDGGRCEGCFVEVTRHVAKTVLSKWGLVAFGSRICVSGNPPSVGTASLLALLNDCLRPDGAARGEGRRRGVSRMRFAVCVVYCSVPEDLNGSAEHGEVGRSRRSRRENRMYRS